MKLFLLLTIFAIGLTLTHAGDDVVQQNEEMSKLLVAVLGMTKLEDMTEMTFTAGKMTNGPKPRPQLTCRPDACYTGESITCRFTESLINSVLPINSSIDDEPREAGTSGLDCEAKMTIRNGSEPDFGDFGQLRYNDASRKMKCAVFKCSVIVKTPMNEAFVDKDSCSLDYEFRSFFDSLSSSCSLTASRPATTGSPSALTPRPTPAKDGESEAHVTGTEPIFETDDSSLRNSFIGVLIFIASVYVVCVMVSCIVGYTSHRTTHINVRLSHNDELLIPVDPSSRLAFPSLPSSVAARQ